MAKIGLFGGSFNPPHIGHVRMACALADSLKLDRVIIMPAHIPPHKGSLNLAEPEQRLEMCRLAFIDDPRFEVSDYEILRPGKSYTVLTVRHIKKEYPDDELYLLMGGDMLLYFRLWYRWTKIAEAAVLVGAPRMHDEMGALAEEAAALREMGFDARMVPIDVTELSSTEVRRAARTSKDISHYVTPEVARYIFEHDLYGPKQF